jgi:hypothetical protein
MKAKKIKIDKEEAQEIVKEPMDDGDIKAYLPNTRILKYSELKKYKSIEELLKPKDAVIILYQDSPNTGHWVALMRNKKYIEYFDSYGDAVDSHHKYIPDDIRHQLGTYEKDLSRILDKAYYDKYKIYYNGYKYQKLREDVASCGAHVVLRILTFLRDNYKLKEYHKLLQDKRTINNNLNYDEIVASLVNQR